MSTTYHLTVKNIIQETKDAISIVFENPENQKLNYKAGQFLTFLLNINGEEIRRSYSLCSSPYTDQYPAVTVKKVVDGKVSNYLNNQVKIGDTLALMEPMGHFTTEIKESKKRHVILFGGGSGITPLMSIMKSILSVESKSVVSLIYCNRDMESIIFKTQLEELQAKYPKSLNIIHILENKPDNNWKEPTGFLNPEMIRELLKRFPKFNFNPTEYYMCGPNGMMDQVILAFEKLKLPKDKLKKEIFSSSAPEIVKVANTTGDKDSKEVTIIYSGETHKFSVRADQSILEAALKLDIDLPYSCQSGMCTACMGKCISGKVKLDEEDALTPKELDQGYVLTCVGHPVTEDVVIEID